MSAFHLAQARAALARAAAAEARAGGPFAGQLAALLAMADELADRQDRQLASNSAS